MKLLVDKVEMRAIKTITSGRGKASSYLLSALSKDCFHYPPARAAYERLAKLVQVRTEVPSWDEIIHDPVIEEDNRVALRKFKKTGYPNLEQAKRALATLDKYRKVRQIYFMSEANIKTLKGQNVDIDELINGNSDILARSRTITNKEDYFFHFGTGNNVDRLVKRVIKGKTASFIRTGIKAFDAINHGFPRKGVAVLAGATSAGKSTMSQQISRNIAEDGKRVCYVPLEMDEEEMTMRRLANISNTSLGKITDAGAALTEPDRKRIYSMYKKYVRGLEKKGGVETYFPPPEDMSIEEILFLLKPYAYDVIIIDYIGLLKGVGGDAAWQKLADAARFAKMFAKNNNCLIILCAQLSDEGQIRYSKGVREHANNMWAWTRNDDDPENNVIYIDQQKCRMGKRFKFPVIIEWDTMTVRDLSEDELAAVGDMEESNDNSNVSKFRKKDKGGGGGGGKFKNAKTVDDKYLAA